MILALEFSSDVRSVAIVQRQALSAPVVLGSAQQAVGQATRAFALVDEALKQAGLQPGDVDTLAVGLGPGSYTGIRMAIAVAQGWQFARQVATVGIGSGQCLVTQALAEGWTGMTHFIVDAHRGEYYRAAYRLGPDSKADEVRPWEIINQAELERLKAESETVAGPEIQKWFPSGRILIPSARTLGQLVTEVSPKVEAYELEPIYLRSPSFVKAPHARLVS